MGPSRVAEEDRTLAVRSEVAAGVADTEAGQERSPDQVFTPGAIPRTGFTGISSYRDATTETVLGRSGCGSE